MTVSSLDPKLHRSYLYAPGSSERVMRKALATAADVVILDLEDAVAPSAKITARAAVAALLDECAADRSGTLPQIHVRVNRAGVGYCKEDLEAAVRPGLVGIRLPKAETADAIREVEQVLGELATSRHLDPGGIELTPTIESALGAVSIPSIARSSPRVARLAIGASDLLADIGAVGDDDLATLHVRSELVLHSRAAGLTPPVDGAYTNLEDEAGLEHAARRARALGFYGKSVIHPRQLSTVHSVFSPSDAELERAERIVAAADAGHAVGSGALTNDDGFIDSAVVARARSLLALRSP